jgi:hypothetical protein
MGCDAERQGPLRREEGGCRKRALAEAAAALHMYDEPRIGSGKGWQPGPLWLARLTPVSAPGRAESPHATPNSVEPVRMPKCSAERTGCASPRAGRSSRGRRMWLYQLRLEVGARPRNPHLARGERLSGVSAVMTKAVSHGLSEFPAPTGVLGLPPRPAPLASKDTTNMHLARGKGAWLVRYPSYQVWCKVAKAPDLPSTAAPRCSGSPYASRLDDIEAGTRCGPVSDSHRAVT